MKKILITSTVAILTVASFIILPTLMRNRIVYTLRLNHDYPSISNETTYLPLTEEAYVVDEHVIMTNNPTKGHFPDDGKLVENDTEATWYWVDFPYGIKAYLVEDILLPFYLRIIPTRLRLFLYPRWIRESYPFVANELKKDGGWKNRLVAFRTEKANRDKTWKEWEEDSESNSRLYEEWWKKHKPDEDKDYNDYPIEIGRKGS